MCAHHKASFLSSVVFSDGFLREKIHIPTNQFGRERTTALQHKTVEKKKYQKRNSNPIKKA